MKPRVTLGLSMLLLVIVLASGWWLWSRLASTLPPEEGSVAPVPARAPSPAAATIAAAGTPAPAGYRLAGVALGEPDSFAVVETASGATALYRLHDEVAGLGELVRIDAERVVIRSETGQFELWLSPAATASPTAVRTPKPSTPTARHPLRRPAARTTPSPIS